MKKKDPAIVIMMAIRDGFQLTTSEIMEITRMQGVKDVDVMDVLTNRAIANDQKYILRVKNNYSGHDKTLFAYRLTLDGRRFLVDYEELEEARKSSKNAFCIALIAIVLNVIFAIISILQPAKIDQQLINDVKTNHSCQVNRLDSLISLQKAQLELLQKSIRVKPQ